MTKQEWLVEFQVIHGRRPTELEEAAAAIDGYNRLACLNLENQQNSGSRNWMVSFSLKHLFCLS